MSNKIKLCVLFALLVVCCVELLMLFKTNKQIDELKSVKKETIAVPEEPAEPPVSPMLTINSEINKSLDTFLFKNEVIDRAVSVGHELVDKQVELGVNLTDATVSDIRHIELNFTDSPDALDMFNVELILTKNDGEKITDNSTYLIFYTRWDKSGKGTHFVTCITENIIEQKYTELSSEYAGDRYLAACYMEKASFLKQGNIISDEELEASAHEIAIAYSETIGVSDIIFDTYTVAIDGNNKMFSFGNSVDDTVITIAYTYFEDMSGWAFLYADS